MSTKKFARELHFTSLYDEVELAPNVYYATDERGQLQLHDGKNFLGSAYIYCAGAEKNGFRVFLHGKQFFARTKPETIAAQYSKLYDTQEQANKALLQKAEEFLKKPFLKKLDPYAPLKKRFDISACSLLDSISEPFDGFEIHPTRMIRTYEKKQDEQGEFYEEEFSVEQCEESEANMFTVYAHLTWGGVFTLADFEFQDDAITFRNLLEKAVKFYDPKKEKGDDTDIVDLWFEMEGNGMSLATLLEVNTLDQNNLTAFDVAQIVSLKIGSKYLNGRVEITRLK